MKCQNQCGNEAFVTVKDVGYCKPCYMALRGEKIERIKLLCNEKDFENWEKWSKK